MDMKELYIKLKGNGSPKSKRVTFIRHGEAEHNVDPLIKKIDTSLTERGNEQKENLKNKFRENDFDIAFISPMIRTIETAEFIRAVRILNAH